MRPEYKEAARSKFERKRFDYAEYKPGGFLDSSYIGNIRGIVFGLLIIYCGKYIVYFVSWIYKDLLGLGSPSAMQLGKALLYKWGSLVAGGGVVALSILSLYMVYRAHRQLRDIAQINMKPGTIVQAWPRPEIIAKVARSLTILPKETNITLRNAVHKWPMLHDVIWGWPLLIAFLLIPFGSSSMSSMFGIFLGGGAYRINHKLSTLQRPLHIRLFASWIVGIAAILIWGRYHLISPSFPMLWK